MDLTGGQRDGGGNQALLENSCRHGVLSCRQIFLPILAARSMQTSTKSVFISASSQSILA
ncbi:MAG: hypothetical protein ACRCWT_06150, partial [Aeromonas veronii]